MNSTALIFKHELLITVKRTGFIVFTLIIPVLFLLGIGIAKIAVSAASPRTPEAERVGYVDETGLFNGFTSQGPVTFRRFETVEEAKRGLLNGEIKEYLVFLADYLAGKTIDRFTTRKEFFPPAALEAAVKSFVTSNLLAGKVPPDAVSIIEAPLAMVTTKLAADGGIAADQGGVGGAMIPLIFCLLLVLSLLFSSGYLLQGLVEEKENRLMEVLVSRVSPRELLIGKILGLGAAGLVQVAVWLASLPLILWMGSSLVGGFFSTLRAPVWFYLLASLYFVLSYLLFATLSASVGAVSSNSREGSQLSALYSMFPVVPLWTMSLFLAFPENPAWVVLSIFPLTAPVMVIERLAITDVPVWQIATSLAALAICAVGGLFLSVRIFRTYLLMYGKRPGLGKLIRSVFAE